MKKDFLLAVILVVLSAFLYASPFGLKMGMTLEEIAEQDEVF